MNTRPKYEQALGFFVITLWAHLVYVCVRMLFMLSSAGQLAHLLESSERWIALLLDGATIAAWAMIVRDTDPERQRVSRAALGVTIASTMIALVHMFFVHAVTSGSPLSILSMLLWSAVLPVSWFAMLELWDETKQPRPTSATTVMWVVVALRAALVVLRFVGPKVLPRFSNDFYLFFTIQAYGGVLVTVVGTALLLSLVGRLRTASFAPSAPVDHADGVLLTSKPQGNDLVVGLVWLLGGIAVTGVSFSMAQSNGGGRYFVSTGAIAYGIVRLVRGLGRR